MKILFCSFFYPVYLLPFMVLTINQGRTTTKKIQVMPAVFVPISSNRPFFRKKDYRV